MSTTTRHKGLMIILDGLGDRPCAALGGQTPLEAAITPHMDRLANAGQCGLVDPLLPGIPVGTHTGVALLMGLAPGSALDLHRGPVEAASTGVVTEPGDILLRGNFATLEPAGDRFLVRDRRAGRISDGTQELTELLQKLPVADGTTATVIPTTQHRVVVRLSGGELSAAITDTDAGRRTGVNGLLPCQPVHGNDPKAVFTASAVNRFIHEAYKRLNGHPINRQREAEGLPPANGIITRGAGQNTKLRSIINHLGLKTALVAGEQTVLGLGRLFDFTLITRPGFTSLASTDLNTKIAAAHAALTNHDLVFLHIKGTDICAHDRDPNAKREFLERIDDALAPLFNGELAIAISGDHSTDSNSGHHTGDPVPSLICSPHGRVDNCQVFGETSCISGGLGRISATGFITTLLDTMDAMHNYKPVDRPYFSFEPAKETHP